MSKKSVVGYSEHRRTDLHVDEANDTFTINTVQDAEPIVEANKSCLLYTSPSPRD